MIRSPLIVGNFMVIQNLLNSKTKTITAAAILISGSSFVSRFLGVIRDRLLVSAFGVGDQLDAYYASFQIPNLLFNFLILGTLSVAFIPVFAQYWQKDNESEAWLITNSILNVTAMLMGSLCLVLFLFAEPLTRLVAPGFGEEKFELTVSLTRLMLLSPFLFSVSAVFGSVLNATKRFLSVAIAPVLYNCSIIIGILLFSQSWGIWAVAASVVIGAGLHLVLQAVAATVLGYRYRPVFDSHHIGVKTIAKLFFPRIWGIDVSQISLFIGTIIGSTFVAGSVAIFNLAVNIQSVPIGILALPFAIAAFPNFVESLAQKKPEQFGATFSYTARQILFFVLPISVLTIVFRAHVVRLIIGVQLLSWNDTRLAAAALGIFAVGFVFQGITPLLSRAFYALKDTVRPVIASSISIVVNVATTIWFVQWLAQDGAPVETFKSIMRLEGVVDIRVLSLPLGFTISSMINMILLVVWLQWKTNGLGYAMILWRAVPISIASIIAGIVAYTTLDLMTPLVNTHTFLGILGQLVVATIMGLVAYAFVSLILRSKEMWQFLRSLERRMVAIIGPIDVSGTEDL